MPPLYLDNAATTRVAPEVAEVVRACMLESYGNPSSAHQAGIEAERLIKTAARQLGAALGDSDGALGTIVWTSGGTESDALGVLGAARARRGRASKVVISAIEHPAVREAAAQLGREGFSVVPVAPDRRGVIDAEAFAAACTEDTAVAALMLVQNELGTVQPVAEVAERIAGRGVPLHCDAVQALGKLPLDVAALGADSIAVAAHKLHGPKGVGALWLKKGARVEPLWTGGGQQGGLRSGTFNVPGIAGLGAAAELAMDGLAERRARFADFSEHITSACRDAGLRFAVNGEGAPRAGHVLSLAFAACPAEPLLHVLESRGVLVSAGSACAGRDRKPSPVLQAIGASEDSGTVRLSFGRDTSREDIGRATEILIDAVTDFQR